MRHLSTERLARLVDEPASTKEKEHLASCEACAAELQALEEQTRALGSLPALRPPSGEWNDLRERLVDEGLVRPAGSVRAGDTGPSANTPPSGATRDRIGPSWLGSPGWLQAAAALVLFLGGAGVGVAASRGLDPAGGPGSGEAGAEVASVESVDEAAEVLQQAEERYVSALIRYRDLAGSASEDVPTRDPASRYAALEGLLAASQAAVRRAPADPFLNGILVSTLAERQATLEEISTTSDNWF